jgi:tripartite-type tricarboxylate transporter receptor subunit TctC
LGRFRLGAGVDAAMSPPKGDVEAMPEVIVGRIDFFFVVLGPALPFIGDGKLQSFAVNAMRRSLALSDVPPSPKPVLCPYVRASEMSPMFT